MATPRTVIIEGKLVPTKISFEGYQLDNGFGDIILEQGIRTEDGTVHQQPGTSKDLQSQLSWVDSNGTSGLDVMKFLGEWFDHVNA